MQQVIHEIQDRFDIKVRKLGDGTALFLFAGSTSSNPYFLVRLYSTGQLRMVEMTDIEMYGDPGNIKDNDNISLPCNYNVA